MFYCAVKNCDNRVWRKTPNGIKFHRFPKNPEIRKLWMDAVKPSETKFSNSSSRVCSKHFKPECYFVSGWLNSDSVPTIFPDNIESNEIPIMPETRVLPIEPKENLVNQYPDYVLQDLEECMKTNALPDFPEAHDDVGNNSSDMTITPSTPFRKRTHSTTSTETTNQVEISPKMVCIRPKMIMGEAIFLSTQEENLLSSPAIHMFGNLNTSVVPSACKLSDKYRADRLARPRMSLLGKPLNYNRGARRDARYRRLQSRVYNFLERPRGLPAILYHVLVFLMVFTCLALSVFSTIDEYEFQAIDILYRMEILVVIWFTIEFALRLWSSGCRSRYQGGMGRLKFLKRPFCIIDVVTIIASLVVIGMGTSQVFATSALRGLRFFQILRMVRMDRRGGTWKLLGSVVYAHRQELITTLYIGFLGLIFASFLVYLMEKDVNEKFSNFAQALWWGVITLCTVGYGDMVPQTWQGKVIASFCALLGISFFALPAGILGSGFALKVQQQQRQKHMIRRRQPAATLIQSLWRCYAADEHSVSVATWKIHQVPLPSPPPSYGTNRKSLIRRASSSFKHNASFVARLPTIRRHKSQSLHSPGNPKPPSGAPSSRGRCPRSGEMNASSDNLEVTNNGRPMNASYSEDSVAETALSKKNSDDGFELNYLTNQYDTISSDSTTRTGNGDVYQEHRESIQYPPALIKIGETTALPVMLCGLLQKELFQQLQTHHDSPSRKIQHHILPQMNSDYMKRHRSSNSNEDDEPRCVQLTNQHKTAIRFIRKMKYFVARRKFKEALKPYDVKDVMEQYAAGHVDLLGRVKNVQTRLDQILGKQGSKAKDVYASKISLASRVVKVERSVADIEEKLDILIKAYMQDRERLLALPLVPDTQHSNNSDPDNAPGPPRGGGSSVAIITTNTTVGSGGSLKQPKPILVDKQFSEPNSPITKSFEQPVQRRPMNRGFSDLGNRIKKRVTLSSIPPQYVGNNSFHDDGCGDVVIVVPSIDSDQMDDTVIDINQDHNVCIETEADIEPISPKTITESSIILMGDDDDDDLDCDEDEPDDSPPWEVYEGDDDDDEIDDTTEDTALLRAAVNTEIVITPMSPVASSHDLSRTDSDGSRNGRKSMDLLSPEMTVTNRLLSPECDQGM